MIKDTRNNGKEHNNTGWSADKESPENGMEETRADQESRKGSAGEDKGGDMPVKEEDKNISQDAGEAPKALMDELKLRNEEIEKKKEEIEALKDILKRRQADFENYKKRVVKSQEEYRKYAIKDMAMDIIHINDDMLRAIDAAIDVCREKETAQNAFIEGIAMISRRIEEMLNKYGVEEIECLNSEFDPNLNEAVEIEESPDVERDTVTKVYQKGFKLDDFVVRSAKVRVTRKMRTAGEKAGPDSESNAGSASEA